MVLSISVLLAVMSFFIGKASFGFTVVAIWTVVGVVLSAIAEYIARHVTERYEGRFGNYSSHAVCYVITKESLSYLDVLCLFTTFHIFYLGIKKQRKFNVDPEEDCGGPIAWFLRGINFPVFVVFSLFVFICFALEKFFGQTAKNINKTYRKIFNIE